MQVVADHELQSVLAGFQRQFGFRLAEPEMHRLVGGGQRQVERRHFILADVDEHVVVPRIGKHDSRGGDTDAAESEPHQDRRGDGIAVGGRLEINLRTFRRRRSRHLGDILRKGGGAGGG